MMVVTEESQRFECDVMMVMLNLLFDGGLIMGFNHVYIINTKTGIKHD